MPRYIAEPLILIGAGEYKLEDLSEIKVTDSFLGMGQDIRDCQNFESLQNTLFNSLERN